MRELSAAEQRYQAVLAVIGEGAMVSEAAGRWGVSRQSVHAMAGPVLSLIRLLWSDSDLPTWSAVLSRRSAAKYRVGMDPRAQEDIAATAAAHRELGPGFEDGLAEGLVERIGAEIDKRVDARLGQRGNSTPTPAAPGQAPSMRPAGAVIAMALGSMLIAVFGTMAAMNGRNGSPALAALIWVVIGVINVAYARRR